MLPFLIFQALVFTPPWTPQTERPRLAASEPQNSSTSRLPSCSRGKTGSQAPGCWKTASGPSTPRLVRAQGMLPAQPHPPGHPSPRHPGQEAPTSAPRQFVSSRTLRCLPPPANEPQPCPPAMRTAISAAARLLGTISLLPSFPPLHKFPRLWFSASDPT